MSFFSKKIEEACLVLSQEAAELYLSEKVAEIDARLQRLTPLEFHRNYVSKNLPVLIKNATANWEATKKWNPEYFKKNLGKKIVKVAVTPDGYADAISIDPLSGKKYFVLPEEREMEMSEFIDHLENPESGEVLYIQQQNSNLDYEFLELLEDLPFTFDWANDAFGKCPDATNFWMGDKRAITSMHKDPYENLYCVISGEKEFILHPPTDLPWIPYGKYPSAIYKKNESSWKIEPVKSDDNGDNLIPWIAVDPLYPNYEKYPEYKNSKAIKVKVKAGDVLYIPSLWFHHVRQSHACIAMNYWYDMEFDIKYAYFKALEVLSK